MKKRIALGLMAVLACLGLSGCEKKKEVTLTLKLPPISLDAANDPEVEDSRQFLEKAAAAFSEQYEDANVTFDIQLFEYTKEDEAITASFDTEAAPDILYEGYFNMGTYIHTGRVVPLDDMISDELRSDVDDSIWEMSQANGKTYMMPFLSLQNVLAYNKELFQECGLGQYVSQEPETIDSWTLEEWEEILDTLAEKLPEGCYPTMMYGKNEQGDTHIMTLIRSHGSSFFDEEGNFNVNTEEGIAALQWIVDGTWRGWYPPQCENLEIADNTELFGNDQLAITITNNASFTNFDKSRYGCVNFPSADGEGIATSFVTGFEVFDNGDADKLAAAKAFVKYVCETDEWAEYSTGGIPARNSVAEKYQDEIFMLAACKENASHLVDFTHNNPNWRGVRNCFYLQIYNLLSGEKTAGEVAADLDRECNAAISEGWSESSLHD